MSDKKQLNFDPMAFTLYTQESFYTTEDLMAAEKDWPMQEVEDFYRVFRA